MSEWQPIDTAPKDGTEIDLWCEDVMETGFRVIEAKWNRRFGTWEVSDEPLHVAIGNEGVHATHWMRPPKPPEQA